MVHRSHRRHAHQLPDAVKHSCWLPCQPHVHCRKVDARHCWLLLLLLLLDWVLLVLMLVRVLLLLLLLDWV